MPKTRAGQIFYALILLAGLLLLGRSLYRKHRPVSTIPERKEAPELAFRQAVATNNPMAVETLLREGVRPEKLKYLNDYPALQQAARAGRAAIVTVLLGHGADPLEKSDYYNTTALGQAIGVMGYSTTQGYGGSARLEDYRAIVAMLRSRGARLSLYEAVALTNWPALLAAYRAGDTADDSKIKSNPVYETPLGCAIRMGNLAMTKWLLEHGAQVNRINGSSGMTPLFEAVSRPPSDARREMVSLLLAHGANVNTPGIYGITPLMGAIADFSGETTALLLARGADIEKTSSKPKNMIGANRFPIGDFKISDAGRRLSLDYGSTVLIQAARNGNLAMVRILLTHGAKVNAVDINGHTALLDALYGHQPQIAALLLAHGANLRVPRKLNDTALLAAAVHAPEAIPLLLKHGADFNERAQDGDTALIRAARNGQAQAIEMLLQAGADPTVVNPTGWTALQWAAGNTPQAVPSLIGAGANVNARSLMGETPLHRAIFANRPGSVRALLAAHADPNTATPRGDTPLQMARKRRQQTIIDMLIQAGAHE